MRTISKSIIHLIIRLWPWGYLALGGLVIHVGTAVLRLNVFYPQLKLLDFVSYYAGAWAMRLHTSPYPWSEEFVSRLMETSGIYTTPPVHNSAPVWAWLLIPLTYFSFDTASLIWLILMLLATAVSTWLLLSTAGYKHKPLWLILFAFLIVLTFGPAFLTLTLGQNSLLLLLSALAVGISINHRTIANQTAANVLWVIAIWAKLYPAFWLPSLLLLRRWRQLILVSLLTLLLMILTWWLYPAINQHYWFHFLPEQGQSAAQHYPLGYQTLIAWLSRLSRSMSVEIPSISGGGSYIIRWSYPWQISPMIVQLLTLIIQIGLALLLIIPWLKKRPENVAGYIYSWVTYSLLILPHMARYNLVLLLPGMAWLWAQNRNGRSLAIVIYFLAALARLTNLWPVILPAPLIPLAAGFGLYAILLLLIFLIYYQWPTNRLRREKLPVITK